MKQQDLLREQYEDALFALLMDEVAKQEGRKALEENERLKHDPSAAVPETTMERCRQTIRRAFARRDRQAVTHMLAKGFQVAAVAVLISALLLSAAVAVSPTIKNAVLNLAIEVFDVKTTFSFYEDSVEEHAMNTPVLEAEWLPQRFKLLEMNQDKYAVLLKYVASNSEFIQITCYRKPEMILATDSENAVVESIVIQDISANLVEKSAELILTIPDEEAEAFITIVASGISREEIIRIGENLVYK